MNQKRGRGSSRTSCRNDLEEEEEKNSIANKYHDVASPERLLPANNSTKDNSNAKRIKWFGQQSSVMESMTRMPDNLNSSTGNVPKQVRRRRTNFSIYFCAGFLLIALSAASVGLALGIFSMEKRLRVVENVFEKATDPVDLRITALENVCRNLISDCSTLKLYKGPVGPKGETGSRGYKGDRGLKGDIGLPGIVGQTGSSGPSGKNGLKGKTGEKGDRGSRGLLGLRGPAGPSGVKGDTGDRGERGEKGRRGLIGTRGPPSECCDPRNCKIPCPPGKQGPKGDPGTCDKNCLSMGYTQTMQRDTITPILGAYKPVNPSDTTKNTLRHKRTPNRGMKKSNSLKFKAPKLIHRFESSPVGWWSWLHEEVCMPHGNAHKIWITFGKKGKLIQEFLNDWQGVSNDNILFDRTLPLQFEFHGFSHTIHECILYHLTQQHGLHYIVRVPIDSGLPYHHTLLNPPLLVSHRYSQCVNQLAVNEEYELKSDITGLWLVHHCEEMDDSITLNIYHLEFPSDNVIEYQPFGSVTLPWKRPSSFETVLINGSLYSIDYQPNDSTPPEPNQLQQITIRINFLQHLIRNEDRENSDSVEKEFAGGNFTIGVPNLLNNLSSSSTTSSYLINYDFLTKEIIMWFNQMLYSIPIV